MVESSRLEELVEDNSEQQIYIPKYFILILAKVFSNLCS